MDRITLMLVFVMGAAAWTGLSYVESGTVAIAGTLAGSLAAWLVVVQLVYQKRREDAQVVKEAIALINKAADLAQKYHLDDGDAWEAWKTGRDIYCLMGVEMRHRAEEVQSSLVAMWDRIEPMSRTGMGKEPLLSWDEINSTTHELTQELMRAYGNLTPLECLRELGAVPGPVKLPEFGLKRPTVLPHRIEPTLPFKEAPVEDGEQA